jgi:hypothetical protein
MNTRIFSFSAAVTLLLMTATKLHSQTFHPYNAPVDEAWAGPDQVYTLLKNFQRPKAFNEYRMFDAQSGELLMERRIERTNYYDGLPIYSQVVNWNSKTYRLGTMLREEGKEKFIDVHLNEMTGEEWMDLKNSTVLASIPGDWAGGAKKIQHRFSPDSSKMLIYASAIFGVDRELHWAVLVLDHNGLLWHKVEIHKGQPNEILDHAVDNEGVAYVLRKSELIRITDTSFDIYKVDGATEDGFWSATMHAQDAGISIFGFIGQKHFKEPKLVVASFDRTSRLFSAPVISEFPYLYKFDPRYVIVVEARDNYWLMLSDRKNMPGSPPYTSTRIMYICRIEKDGSLDWALQVPKPMTTYQVDQPDIILYPDGEQLILLFQEYPDALEARIKGEEPKIGIRLERSQEYDIIQMTVSPDERTEFNWLEVDGARCRWGSVHRIDETTFFCGDAHKDEKKGFVYWEY